MVRLPLHPRLARLLIEGADSGRLVFACRIAAQLSNRSGGGGMVERTEKQLLQLMNSGLKNSPAVKSTVPEIVSETGQLYLSAWPDRVAMQREVEADRYLLASGRGAVISRSCGSQRSRLIVAVQVDGGSGAEGVIHQAESVTLEQVRQSLPHMISRSRAVRFDDQTGRVVAAEEERLGALVLSAKAVVASDDEALPLLLEQISRRGISILNWSAAARQLQGRVGLAARFLPEDGWPDLSDSWLTENLEQWLGPLLLKLRSWQEVQKLDLVQALQGLIGWKMSQMLDTVVPVSLLIPSGRRAVLDYEASEGPVLAAKLQELFGLAESPTICRGRLAVLVHLLSPAGRPLAVTRDLKGFWERSYLEVRKEMRGRYPKHPWPDDPWNAPATHRTKKAAGIT
jgi:ATP-dependent helicase HrpB